MQHQIILVRLIKVVLLNNKGFPGGASGKEPACQWRDIRENVGLIPGLGGSPGGGHGIHSRILVWRIQGQRILVGYRPQGHKELDRIQVT